MLKLANTVMLLLPPTAGLRTGCIVFKVLMSGQKHVLCITITANILVPYLLLNVSHVPSLLFRIYTVALSAFCNIACILMQGEAVELL